MSIDLSVIVVSYNTREMTLEAIRSLYRETRRTSFELIVVDNASSDGSAEAIAREFPSARLLAETDNHGFARANNLAAQLAQGDFILLLNPDTVVLDGAVDRLMAFAIEQPQAEIWGGRTLFGDHRLNPTSCWRRMTLWNVFCRASGLANLLRNNPLFDSEAYGGWPRDSVRRVDIVTGCFFLTRRSFWNALGGFSPRFFMYGEEADFCLRARRLGARPMVTPEATIVHYGGASEKVRVDKVVRLFRAKVELMRSHWSCPAYWLGLGMYYGWAWSRAFGFSLVAGLTGRARHRETRDQWLGVWRDRKVWSRGFGEV
jgi:GT2 family glycosyltransferase